MALTQTQLVTAVAERAQLTNRDAKRALAALDEIVLGEIATAQKVRIGGLVQSQRKSAQRPQPGNRRADHDRGQACQR